MPRNWQKIEVYTSSNGKSAKGSWTLGLNPMNSGSIASASGIVKAFLEL
jgi:hypothetical protein